MFLNKLRTTLLLLAAGAVACAAGLAALARVPANPPAPEAVLAPVPPAAEKPEDGVYLLKFEGEGRRVTLTDGSEAVLGKQLSKSIGTGTGLRSWSNDNSRFHFGVKGLGPLPKEVTEVQTALVVNGVVLHVGRPENLNDDGKADVGASVYSAEAARTLAARYKIEPELRKHPGHRYEVRWIPAKKRYEAGEVVKLTMEIKNTGTGPLRFAHGGQQRGARDNQFRFIAQGGYGGGKGVPDTGDPENHGGKVRVVTLKPGESYTAEVELTKWFKFAEPDSYRITGVFEMPVIDPLSEKFGPVTWDDLAVGECTIRVVAKK
jgi:hypothetical protein